MGRNLIVHDGALKIDILSQAPTYEFLPYRIGQHDNGAGSYSVCRHEQIHPGVFDLIFSYWSLAMEKYNALDITY